MRMTYDVLHCILVYLFGRLTFSVPNTSISTLQNQNEIPRKSVGRDERERQRQRIA